MPKYNHIKDLTLLNKRVFVRVDFNVPLSGEPLSVSGASRITATVPTIQHIIGLGGKCILASHLGRPKGKVALKYSLEPVGEYLSGLLGKDIILSDSCVGDGARSLTSKMAQGDVVLLENLRFHPGEENNDPELAEKLLSMCDIYVGEAFGTLHRAHASTFGLPMLVPIEKKCIGYLVAKEIENLTLLRDHSESPFALVLGGAKVSDKIGLIESLFDRVQTVLVGGAMAYAFLKAQGKGVGNSYCPADQVETAKKLLERADARHIKMLLPIDHAVGNSLEDSQRQTCDDINIPVGKMGLDIGVKTIAIFSEVLRNAKTIFWNGPVGVFENNAFALGTLSLAEVIASCEGKKMAGGGDVVAAIGKSGFGSSFDFISTGGGAALEFLEGKRLPGLQALEIPKRMQA